MQRSSLRQESLNDQMKRKNLPKRYKKHNNHKILIRGAAIVAVLVGVVYIVIRSQFGGEAPNGFYPEEADMLESERVYEVQYSDEPVRDYGKAFDDKQELQLPAARAMGVGPLTEDTLRHMLESGRLVQLSDTTPTYYLHEVKYPYLTPEAKHTLAYIAEAYQKRVGDPSDRLRVTSLVRTTDHVKRLRRGNVNAVEESCHLYGTTFDISYRDLDSKQKQALARVLRDLRDSGYCYVKYERKQPCFHITIRK